MYLQSFPGKFSDEEVKAIFGIKYMAGILKSNHTNLSDMWATDATID